MTIELVIFDLGPQLIQTGPRLEAAIEAAFVWTELGDVDDGDLSTAGAFARLRGLREVRGTSAAFASLRAAGVRIAIATGCSRGAVAGVMTRLGWTGLVDAVVSAEDSDGCRPSQLLVRIAMARTGVKSALNVAKVADTPSGLLEGYSAGCGTVIAVQSPDQDEDDDLLLYPHTHRVETSSLVPELLRRLDRRPPMRAHA
jgi:phosphoglycolate phosphatase-like HAD superfamily hydrolase